MTLIIGFGHKARQGKDTAVEAVVNYYAGQKNVISLNGLHSHAPTVRQFRFAEALYQECRDNYGMTEKDAPLLQQVGSLRRAEDPDYWVKKVFNAIPTNLDIAVISDVRYRNEALAVSAVGGYLVHVSRLNADGSNYIADDRPANHPSEIDLDGFNWDFSIVAKSGELVLVAEQAITLVEYIRG